MSSHTGAVTYQGLMRGHATGDTQVGSSDKVVLIGNAGTEVGKATAIQFSRAGARLFLTDVELATIQETAEEISAPGGVVTTARFNPCRAVEAESMVNAVLETYGELHCAVNTIAGHAEYCRLHEIEEEGWDRVFGAALKSTWLSMKYQIPAIKASGGGAIVNVASRAGLQSPPGLSAFCAAAASVISLSNTAAAETVSDGIRVNAISPGGVFTPSLARLCASEPGLERYLERADVLGALATPEQVAACVVYLCSDEATSVNGHNILVQGGEEPADIIAHQVTPARRDATDRDAMK